MEFTFPIVILAIAVMFVLQAVKVVPQQSAWVLERFGKYNRTLLPGLNIIIPFIDRVAYRHSLKEIPMDVPSQVCITRDNTQLQVDGVIYFQVTDPMKASYGSSNFVFAITQLAQTSLRSVIGKLELDKTFEERDDINRAVVAALDEAAQPDGARVCSLAPGVIDTDMQVQLRSASAHDFPDAPNFAQLQHAGMLSSAEQAARQVLGWLQHPLFGSEPVADVRHLPPQPH